MMVYTGPQAKTCTECSAPLDAAGLCSFNRRHKKIASLPSEQRTNEEPDERGVVWSRTHPPHVANGCDASMIEVPTLPCIACGAILRSAIEGIPSNQPSGGLVFSTYGHYGSTVFDPMDDVRRLEINVCDACLTKAIAKRAVLEVHPGPTRAANVHVWPEGLPSVESK